MASTPRDPAAASQLAETWGRWFDTRAPADRAHLIEAHAVLVRRIAARCFRARASSELEFRDFVQLGTVGLIEALDRYRPDRGASFETFASYRVEGSILNGIEHMSERQQQITARRRITRERSQSLLGEAAETKESAIERLARVAIGLAIGFALDDSGLYLADEDSASVPDNAYSHVEMKQMRAQLAALVESLPEQQRHVIHRHYVQQVRFEEIARNLGLTKGRVSQIHRAGIEGLRARLGGKLALG